MPDGVPSSLSSYSALKRQQDSRHKQLDRFEAGLKNATEAQRQWRARVQSKTVELETAKVRRSPLFVLSRIRTGADSGSPRARRPR